MTRICARPTCQREVTGHPRRIYCGDKCAQDAVNERKRAQRIAAKEATASAEPPKRSQESASKTPSAVSSAAERIVEHAVNRASEHEDNGDLVAAVAWLNVADAYEDAKRAAALRKQALDAAFAVEREMRIDRTERKERTTDPGEMMLTLIRSGGGLVEEVVDTLPDGDQQSVVDAWQQCVESTDAAKPNGAGDDDDAG